MHCKNAARKSEMQDANRMLSVITDTSLYAGK
jgi:hypothetical protein